MTIIGLILVALIFCFGFVLLFGAPYLPTLTKQMQVALDLVDLQPGERLVELGCGDGKVLVAAARRGWLVDGYELNPLLVLVCVWRTRHFRKQVRVHWRNFWTAQLPPTEGIFVFVLQRQMAKLDNKIVQEVSKPVKLVSFAFTIPGRKPVRSKEGVYLYEYR
ncbi:MAG TPA: hypothetical protein VFH39_03725 [Candidatus Saccharimonadales bacterium]|nr:hypothetical protein [Candidatus Saccharimonadales bacterium]